MNESAPAPLRVPVPWWERLAAGVLAASWVGWVLFDEGGVARWWRVGRQVAAEVTAIWQRTLASGTWAAAVDPGTWDFAALLCYGCFLVSELAMAVLTPLALWVASRGGSLRLRRLFWLAVVGYGLAKLGQLAASGRLVWVTMAPSLPWHEGWLDRVFWPELRVDQIHLLRSSLAILLGTLFLAAGWRQKQRGQAANALASGSAEGAGSRA